MSTKQAHTPDWFHTAAQDDLEYGMGAVLTIHETFATDPTRARTIGKVYGDDKAECEERGCLIAAAPDLLAAAEAVLSISEKSMLADCAYQGPPPKKWIRETAPYYDGYNKALNECQEKLRAAIAKATSQGPEASNKP